MAGSKYPHNGTFLLRRKPHSQRSREKDLPRHKQIQPPQHHSPPFPPLPRPSVPLTRRRQEDIINQPNRTSGLRRLQSRLLHDPPLHLDRQTARHLVGPRPLRTETHGVGAQRARQPRTPLHPPAMGQTARRLHPTAKNELLPARCLWRRHGSRNPLPAQRQGFPSQHGWLRMGTRLLVGNLQLQGT